jgi:transcriptional regulator with XRE-family HTH domain
MTAVMDVNRFAAMPTTQYERDLLRFLSENVTRFRTMRGWTQQELADKLKMHVSTIRQIEGNKLEERPRPRTLSKLADVFGRSVEDLFESTDALPAQKESDKPAAKTQSDPISDLMIEVTKKLGVKEQDMSRLQEENRKLLQRIAELEAELAKRK